MAPRPYRPFAVALLSLAATSSCRTDVEEKLDRLAEDFCKCKTHECFDQVNARAEAMFPDRSVDRLMRDHPAALERCVQAILKCWERLPAVDTTNLEMPFAPSEPMPEFPTGSDEKNERR